MKIGERYSVIPAFAGDTVKTAPQVGRVVYVHPRGRYAVLEFDGVFGCPREGFAAMELPPEKRCGKRKE